MRLFQKKEDTPEEALKKSRIVIRKAMGDAIRDADGPVSSAAADRACWMAEKQLETINNGMSEQEILFQRKEEKRQRVWHDVNEDVKYVCDGAKVTCPFCSKLIGTFKATSTDIKLQGKPWGTVGDCANAKNIVFEGICNHPKWGSNKPTCQEVMSLGKWKHASKVIIGNYRALLVKSTIPCAVSSYDIKIVHSGQTATMESKKQTEVQIIKIIEQLDEGSFNDGTGKVGKRGFIHGKTYTLEATHFANGVPEEDEIKWEAEFIYPSGERANVIYQNSLEKWHATGRKVTFTVESPDLLGGTLVFYAYVSRPREEAIREVWVHYRFRYFDSEKVKTEILMRKNDPWLINQSGTSLCGMAALFYIFAKTAPSLYEKFVTDLHHKGTTDKGYPVEPYEDSKEIMYNMNPNSSNYPVSGDGKSMPLADWLALAVLRSHESTHWPLLIPIPVSPGFICVEKTLPYSGEREERSVDSLAAVNWPTMMERLCKDFLGYGNVETVGLSLFLLQQKKRPLGGWLYDKFSDSDLDHLMDIDKAYKSGAEIIMMIDSQMFEDVVSYSYKDLFTNSHWIVYEGGLTFYDEKELIVNDIDEAVNLSFKFFTWGNDPNLSTKLLAKLGYISIKCFKSTFYGYIKCHH